MAAPAPTEEASAKVIEIPRTTKGIDWKRLTDLIQNENNDTRLQLILDSLPASAFNRAFHKQYPLFSGISEILKQVGFSPMKVGKWTDFLKESGIPSRRVVMKYKQRKGGKEYDQTFNIIYAKHEERVHRKLKEVKKLRWQKFLGQQLSA